MYTSDLAAVEAVRGGDLEAYRELVDRYRDRLFGVLIRMTGDRQLADELAQDAFVKAYLNLGKYRGEAAFGTWLIQIGIHALRDRSRRQQRQRRHGVVSLDAYRERENEAAEPSAPLSETDSLDQLCRQEDDATMQAALRKLPTDYREVLVLKHLEGWSFAEIAAATGASTGALKVRAHRARILLKEELAALGWNTADPDSSPAVEDGAKGGAEETRG